LSLELEIHQKGREVGIKQRQKLKGGVG
jgi:hypothetical protein